MTAPEPQPPMVFISYSWDDEEHREWVHALATRLREDGVAAELDQWEVHLGDPLPEFMERAVRENDFVLVVGTPNYKRRSEGRVGGVGYEGDIMTAEVFSTRNHRKFIPVLRRGGWNSGFPSWLHGKAGVDLRRDPYSEEQYRRLLGTLHGHTPQRPPLGPRPEGITGEAITETDQAPNMSLGIRPGQLPPFHELDEYVFQELCRDLLDAELSVATCGLYGVRGQAQYGIDLLAVAADDGGIEVGQCKRYEHFTPRQIEQAREEFFEHYGSRWQPRKVKRFVLFVAGDLSSTQHQEKILEETELFAAFGIGYEVWSAAQIRNKLRPRPDIVSTYLLPAEHWVRVICGTSLPASHPAPAMQLSAADRMYAALWERVERRESEEAERRLEDMREAWHEGRRREAVSMLDALKADGAMWEAVSPGTRAKVLRFEAGAKLHISGDVAKAKRLADEARALSPLDDETRVRAVIARAEIGPGAAADLLAERRDTDSVNLRASLLLEQGDFNGFGRALGALPEGQQEPNAESAQLRALKHLLHKETDQARLEADKASELAPGWESIRFTAGVVDYMGALSPAALPDYLVDWPEPVDWTLIKRDDESLARLRRAAAVFRSLAEDVEDEDDRRRYETWLLACLANDPEGQEEAVAYCRRLLEHDPSHQSVVLWAVVRNFSADLADSETRLRNMVRDGSAELPHVLALSTLLMVDGRADEATNFLGETRSIFEAADAIQLWTSWHAQSLALGGDPQAAIEELDASDVGGELRRVRTVALGMRAERTGDWTEILEHLERSYEETADARFLFDACEIRASRQDWAYVADKAEQLVEELGTADSLRIAAVGTCNDNKFELCMRLLDGRRDLLPGGRLPRELREVRLNCQHGLGLLSDAVREAEQLDREEPTVASGLSLLVVRFSLGNRPGVVEVARQLADRAGLSDEQGLGVAEMVRTDDPDLARRLWRKAVREDLPDELVARALNLGYGLGLENEMRPLMARAMELAGRGEGGLQAMNLQEALEFFERRREGYETFQRMYLDGAAPIHLAPEAVGVSLAGAYHRGLFDNESAGAPAESPFLLVAHGARADLQSPSGNLTEGRLILDVTAVLLAEHLSILGKVEESFDDLRVPQELMQALTRMRDQAYPDQPARRGLLEQIVRLADEGVLRGESIELPERYENASLVEEMGEPWVVAFETARAREGYLVDFLPLTTLTNSGSAPAALPDDASNNLVNAGSILEALRIHGPLSEIRVREIRESLGEEGQAYSDHPVPGIGSYLYLDGGVAEVLAGAGLLEVACDRFRVHMGAQDLLRVRADLRGFEMAVEDAEWLEGLIDRLRQGLESGVYATVVAPAASVRNSLRDSYDPTVHCLDTILRFEAGEGDTVWVDDRAVNKYRSRDGVPVIGVYDVWRQLRSSGTINDEDYYSALIKLRASNARFLPIESGEILYHLDQARVEDGQLVETIELRTLRRYAAACLVRGDILHRPTTQSDGVVVDPGEIPFIVQLSRAVTEVLTHPWEDVEDEVSSARAEWLLTNMFLGYAGLTNVVELPGSGQDERPKVAFDLRDLIVRAVAMPSDTPGERLARGRLLRWLEARILSKRLAADPALLSMTASEVKASIMEARQGLTGVAPEPMVAMSLGKKYQDLPRSVHDELSKDPEFMAAVGMATEIRVQVGPFQFPSEVFWRAVAEAVNGRPASLTTVGEEPVAITLRAADESATLVLVDPITGNEPTVTHRYIPLVSESVAARETALRENRSWFDCPDGEFKAAVAEIASATDPLRRVEEAERWRSTSAAAFYEDLGEKLLGPDPVYLNDLLPPDAERLLKHLRLGGGSAPVSAFVEEAERAAEQLLREEGLTAALQRFAGLPVPLPSVLLDAARTLPAQDQRELVHVMVGSLGSPVSKLHMIHLLVYLGDTAAYLRLAGWVARTLLCERGAEEYRAFSAVLRWVSDEFDFRPDTRALPAHVRLAIVWYHAHRLFSATASAGIPYEHTTGEFDRPDKRVTSEVFEREAAYWQDICHPRRADRVSFVHMGLVYAFGTQTEHVDTTALQRVGDENRGLSLLRDPSRAHDGLGSFLGGDRGEALSGLLAQEEAEALRASSLENLTAGAVEHLDDEGRMDWAWAILFHVLGDQPPPEHLKERIKQALLDIDLVELVRKDTPTGLAVLRTASSQVFNLEDEGVRSRLKDQLVALARYFAEKGRREGASEIDVHAPGQQAELRALIEFAVHVSSAVRGERAYTEFANLLSKLTDSWPAAAAFNKPVVLRLCEELEAAKIKPFWRVLNRLRAQ